MKITQKLAAVSAAAIVALAGCSTGGGQGEDQANPGGQPAASDGGGQQPGASQAPEADVSDVPEVVAQVNGEDISKDEFVQSYEPQYQQSAMSGQQVDQAQLKTQVAEQLVDNRLLLQAAEDAGIEATDEDIDAILEDVASQNGMGSADEVVSALEEQGMSAEQIREDAASQHMLDTYISQEADIQEPSDEELRKQYDQLVQQQSQGGGQASDQGGGQGGDQSQVPPFEEVRDQLAEQAVTQQENEAATSIAEELRADADVTINV